MCELPHELPNDLKLRILRNVPENREKPAVYYFIEKPILLNFDNLLTIFRPRL